MREVHKCPSAVYTGAPGPHVVGVSSSSSEGYEVGMAIGPLLLPGWPTVASSSGVTGMIFEIASGWRLSPITNLYSRCSLRSLPFTKIGNIALVNGFGTLMAEVQVAKGSSTYTTGP